MLQVSPEPTATKSQSWDFSAKSVRLQVFLLPQERRPALKCRLPCTRPAKSASRLCEPSRMDPDSGHSQAACPHSLGVALHSAWLCLRLTLGGPGFHSRQGIHSQALHGRVRSGTMSLCGFGGKNSKTQRLQLLVSPPPAPLDSHFPIQLGATPFPRGRRPAGGLGLSH